VPRHGPFKYLAFEPGAEVHGLERLLGLLKNFGLFLVGKNGTVLAFGHWICVKSTRTENLVINILYCVLLQSSYSVFYFLLAGCGVWFIF
jgi:hypothetical protein